MRIVAWIVLLLGLMISSCGDEPIVPGDEYIVNTIVSGTAYLRGQVESGTEVVVFDFRNSENFKPSLNLSAS